MIHENVEKRINEKKEIEREYAKRSVAISYLVCPKCSGDLVREGLIIFDIFLGQQKYRCTSCGETYKRIIQD